MFRRISLQGELRWKTAVRSSSHGCWLCRGIWLTTIGSRMLQYMMFDLAEFVQVNFHCYHNSDDKHFRYSVNILHHCLSSAEIRDSLQITVLVSFQR